MYLMYCCYKLVQCFRFLVVLIIILTVGLKSLTFLYTFLNWFSRHFYFVIQQTINAMSQISFTADESVSPKKPTSLAEVAKQRELSGTLDRESDAKSKKQISDAKCKELIGHDIFGPPPEIPARPLAARNLEKEKEIGEPLSRSIHTSVKVSNVSALFSAVNHLSLALYVHSF